MASQAETGSRTARPEDRLTEIRAQRFVAVGAVRNMTCSACPFIVKSSLEAAPGVAKVAVSFADKTVTVTFDDAKTTVPALIRATTNAGYPSGPKS